MPLTREAEILLHWSLRVKFCARYLEGMHAVYDKPSPLGAATFDCVERMQAWVNSIVRVSGIVPWIEEEQIANASVHWCVCGIEHLRQQCETYLQSVHPMTEADLLRLQDMLEFVGEELGDNEEADTYENYIAILQQQTTDFCQRLRTCISALQDMRAHKGTCVCPHKPSTHP